MEEEKRANCAKAPELKGGKKLRAAQELMAGNFPASFERSLFKGIFRAGPMSRKEKDSFLFSGGNFADGKNFFPDAKVDQPPNGIPL